MILYMFACTTLFLLVGELFNVPRVTQCLSLASGVFICCDTLSLILTVPYLVCSEVSDPASMDEEEVMQNEVASSLQRVHDILKVRFFI